MRIAFFGTGYTGLVSGVCFADLGNDVRCVDVDAEKIARLQRGEITIYEPGLEERLARCVREDRLHFTTDQAGAVRWAQVIFVCVGTPSAKDGSVDLSYVDRVLRSIAAMVGEEEKTVVLKSTVPVGTADRARAIFREADATGVRVVSNPEFLREGAAVNDFSNPDRVIVGIEKDDARSRALMEKLYQGVARTSRPLVFTDSRSAELIKYAANTMLAARISFMNQLSLYCEAVGADITAVARGVGLDSRIGSRFIHSGVGYGGSCFPKDVRGLITSVAQAGCDASVFRAIDAANTRQREAFLAKARRMLGAVKGKRVAVWGLSFKPKTDDVREAPALAVVEWLLEQGASVSVYDPEAMENFKRQFPGIDYVAKPYDALVGADLLILMTEWDTFRNPDWERVRELMRAPKVLDGRNIYPIYRSDFERLGFQYCGIGVPGVEPGVR